LATENTEENESGFPQISQMTLIGCFRHLVPEVFVTISVICEICGKSCIAFSALSVNSVVKKNGPAFAGGSVVLLPRLS
jgi:hypothetical protein